VRSPEAEPEAIASEGVADDPRDDSPPDDLSGLTVRKARPYIDAAEDLEVVRKWAMLEANGLARAGILDPLEQRFLDLGGEPPSDDALLADDAGEDGGA